MPYSRSSLILATLLCISCASEPLPAGLDGIWISDGYGIGAVVEGAQVRSFAITDRTCQGDGTNPLRGLLKEYSITQAQDNQSFLLRMKNTEQAIRFNRRAQLPVSCDREIPNTPTGNFEVFVDTFATHYAFFDLYNVDWDKEVAKARPLVNDDMSYAALFAVMRDLIAPLRDGHITLKGQVGRQRQIFEPNPGGLYEGLTRQAQIAGTDPEDAIDAFQKAYWNDSIRDTILGGTGTRTGSDFVQYGFARSDVGYIALATMAGYARGEVDYLAEDLAEIDRILDDALAQFTQANVNAVILDLSLNFGGYDEVAFRIASRFAAQESFALSEYPGDAKTPLLQRRSVRPSDRIRFTGPVYIVTSDMTVSAGEILTIALRALPNTTHVGASTRGALSDVLEKELPNGWEIELSNEIYADSAGKLWEGRGIKPIRSFDVFSPQDPVRSHFDAIQRLLEDI